MNEFVNTLDEAIAALADPASPFDYCGVNTAWGVTFHLIARKGRLATHGYDAEALIRFVDRELF